MARKHRNSVNQANQPQHMSRDDNAVLRTVQVGKLRLQGLEFAQIAEQTGYKDASGAWRAWKRYLKSLPAEETEEQRIEARQRLNVALAAIWEKVKAGDMWAIDRMLAIESRRAALLGLDIVRSPAGRPPEEVRREYVGVNVADFLNGYSETISANGSSPAPLQS